MAFQVLVKFYVLQQKFVSYKLTKNTSDKLKKKKKKKLKAH